MKVLKLNLENTKDIVRAYFCLFVITDCIALITFFIRYYKAHMIDTDVFAFFLFILIFALIVFTFLLLSIFQDQKNKK